MSTVTQRSVVSSLALIALGVASPSVVSGQLSRPASVALTMIVPPRPLADPITTEGTVSLVGVTPTAVDLKTSVGSANHPASRIEVRLGANWTADSTSVWVQNRRGEFERVLRDTSIVALDASRLATGARTPLLFRVESSRPLVVSSLAVPLEYRVTVGRGDQFSVWSFSTVLRVDSHR